MNVRTLAKSERFVVLGAAPVRREWFGRVGKWANEARLPVEFIKCISMAEVRSRLDTGRPFSAVLVDAGTVGLDRDLLDHATSQGCAAIVVDHGLVARDWKSLGAAAVLPERFEAPELLAVLEDASLPIERASSIPAPDAVVANATHISRSIAVTGAGGVGTSTVAMALAQGLSVDQCESRDHHLVLADMALRSGQAMLHDARDVVPSLTELVESHRLGVPTDDEVNANIFDYPERGYHLLLGLRNHRDWMTISARALDATWSTLRRKYKMVVADVGGNFDGVDATGSADIEDQNRLSRTAALHADLVLAVGGPSTWGINHLVRTVLALEDIGVEPERILPVVNRSPRQPRQRAAITSAISDLLRSRLPGEAGTASPIFLPERRQLEQIHRDALRLPSILTRPLANAANALLDSDITTSRPEQREPVPVLVAAGSLGVWSDDE